MTDNETHNPIARAITWLTIGLVVMLFPLTLTWGYNFIIQAHCHHNKGHIENGVCYANPVPTYDPATGNVTWK